MKRLLVNLTLLISVLSTKAQMTKQYTNPILAGFYPDPAICRVKDDYYLINSTFAYFPGIPVFHSKDLVNWKLIGHVMSRPEQMDLTGFGVSRGIFAPSIHYHKGLFYVVCTLVDGRGNFVVTAKDPAGPWSIPRWIPEVNGIDPSLFFDEDGKTYIIYNSIPPDDQSVYDGHRTIRMRPFDLLELKVIGEEKIIVNGGSDISKKPIWIEGPHIFKKYGYYYLIAAEGGTGYDHSVVVFRSKHVAGPFMPYSNNPILTQRHLDASRTHPVTSTGHADLVELPNGEWQAVFLGCRPYEGDQYNTGRETFLAPVTWKDEWPVMNQKNNEVNYYYPLPLPVNKDKADRKYSGNFSYRDDFNKVQLSKDWMFLRTPTEQWYNLTNKKGFLSLQLRPETCAGRLNPSFLARRQQHLNCEASTSLRFNTSAANEKAGLIIFQNGTHFYYLCQSVKENLPVVELYRSTQNAADSNMMEVLAAQSLHIKTGKPLYLKIQAVNNSYAFYYSTDNKKWQLLKDSVDARFLSTKTAGGFVGCTFALYATSLGVKTKASAFFDWFEYRGDDPVYRMPTKDNQLTK